MEFCDLISGLGEQLGIELDASGDSCAIEADGMSVVIQDVPEAYSVGLWGSLGTPADSDLRLCQAMLEANHLFKGTNGATISRDPESGSYYLCRLMDIRGLDRETFVSRLSAFIDTMDAWKRLLGDYVASAPAQNASAPDARPPDFSGTMGFLKV